MTNSILKYLDYFFVLRPTLFFPVWTVFLASYHANKVFDQSNPDSINSTNPFLVGILLTLLMGSAFIINQLKDIVSDRKNHKLFIIANGYIKTKAAILETFVLMIVAVTIAFFLNFKIGLAFIAVYVVTGILYNIPPYELKNRPIGGIVANFLGGITVSATGWLTAGTDNWRFIIHAIPYSTGLVAVYFLTTLADISGDAQAGKQTVGVKYGYRTSVMMALFFEIVTIAISFYLGDYILYIPAILSFPLFLICAVTRKLEDVLRTVKFTVLFASLAVCVKFPYYLVLLVLLFYFSKWYYRKRFNIEYPKFAA